MSHKFLAKEIRFYSLGMGASFRSQQETAEGMTAQLQVFTIYKDVSRIRGDLQGILSTRN